MYVYRDFVLVSFSPRDEISFGIITAYRIDYPYER